VNIPEGALYLYQIYNDRQFLLKKYPCSVGLMEFKTPEGNFLAHEFSWNPGWTPPKSTWAKDLLPIEPGNESPLGAGAMVVSYEQAILIHGTKAEKDIGKPASHGCIRLSNKNVTELLSYVQDHVKNSVGQSELSTYRANRTTRYRVYLDKPVAVKLVYRRMEKQGSQVLLYPDVYTREHISFKGFDKNTVLAGRSENTFNVLSDLFKKSPMVGTESFSAMPYPYTGSKQKAMRKYYASTRVRLFVWYINNFGQAALAKTIART
jgi:murein L,D-transpeptidase YcbB/YkuD